MIKLKKIVKFVIFYIFHLKIDKFITYLLKSFYVQTYFLL